MVVESLLSVCCKTLSLSKFCNIYTICTNKNEASFVTFPDKMETCATAADCQLHFHVLPHVKSKILSGEILLSLREIHCLSMSKYTNVHIYTKIFKTFGTCLA